MSKEDEWCYYSGMPSPNAYKETKMSEKKVTKYIIELQLLEVEVDKDSEKEDYWKFDEIEAEIEPLSYFDDYDEAQKSFNDYVKQLT